MLWGRLSESLWCIGRVLSRILNFGRKLYKIYKHCLWRSGACSSEVGSDVQYIFLSSLWNFLFIIFGGEECLGEKSLWCVPYVSE